MAVDMSQPIAAPSRDPQEKSRPVSLWLPEEFKAADVNRKKGIVTAYLTVYNNADGTPYIDPYLDIIEPGSFTKTIRELDQARKHKDNPWYCASLWQHDRKEVIGGIKGLTEDSKGVIYESQLLLSVQRAQEAFDLAEAKMIGSSFGYDPIRFQHKGDIRHLIEIRLHEQSYVTFPANDIAAILDTKGSKPFYVGGKFPVLPGDNQFSEEDEQQLAIKAVCGSINLPLGPRDEVWDSAKARLQYKKWGMDEAGNVLPNRYKQVHLYVDGNPHDITAYEYPICYIQEGMPRICIDAVKQVHKQARSLKSAESAAVKQKCDKLIVRINQKYAHSPLETDNSGLAFDWKQDFADAWTQKLPQQMLQEFFRMSDTLTYIILSNLDDDDVADKTSMVDTCISQYGSSVKSWLPDYLEAEAAQDAMSDDDSSGSVGSFFGLYAADMAGISMKRVLQTLQEKTNEKEGRSLSDKNKKKLRTSLDDITTQLQALYNFVDGEESTVSIDENDGGEPKNAPSDFIHDITSGLEELNTLTPGQFLTSSEPFGAKSHSPVSFPTLPEASEVDISDLLASMRQTFNGGSVKKD